MLTSRCSFPKAARVLARRHFHKIMQNGRKFSSGHIMIHYRLRHAKRPRLGVTVSKKHGKAHERNRFKRIVREAFRKCQPLFPTDLEMNITPLARGKLSTSYVVKDFERFVDQLS